MKVKVISFSLLLIAGLALAADNRETYVVTTVAGIAGVAGSQDGPASEATFNRPTWIDVAAYDQYSFLHKGDIYVVDRANEAIRKISPSGEVSTYTAPSWFQSPISQTYRFDFGGPLGGGIAIEPQGSGCGGSQYDSGFYVASTGSQQIPLMSFVGILANRDGNVILGVTGTYNTAPPNVFFRAPTGIALGPDYRGPQNFAIHMISFGIACCTSLIRAGTRSNGFISASRLRRAHRRLRSMSSRGSPTRQVSLTASEARRG